MISVCMIVKNEIDVLEKCILSVKDKLKKVVNDIVVVDTGSTDGTKELAQGLGCRVYDFEWVNDFAIARNFSVSKAKNDWVLILDADEYIVEVDQKELKDLCSKQYEHVLANVVIASLNDDNEIFDKIRIGRLYNRKKYKFSERIHETLFPIGEFSTAGYKLKLTVEHTGYMKSTKTKKDKNQFYIKMLKESLDKDENNLYLTGHLATCYKEIEEYEKSIECYEKVVFSNSCSDKPYYLMFVKEYLKLLILLEQYSVAVICEHLWSYCSHDDQYVFYMGIIFLQVGQNEKAINCFLDCINKTEENILDKKHSFYQLAGILEQIGDLNNSLVCYKQCGSFENAEVKVKEIQDKLK